MTMYCCHNCGNKQSNGNKCMSCNGTVLLQLSGQDQSDGTVPVGCWNCGQSHQISYSLSFVTSCTNCGKKLR